MKKVRMLVSGRVQGVGFRYSTYALALEIGDIYGRVWNNDDGTVEILAQSDDNSKSGNRQGKEISGSLRNHPHNDSSHIMDIARTWFSSL